MKFQGKVTRSCHSPSSVPVRQPKGTATHQTKRCILQQLCCFPASVLWSQPCGECARPLSGLSAYLTLPLGAWMIEMALTSQMHSTNISSKIVMLRQTPLFPRTSPELLKHSILLFQSCERNLGSHSSVGCHSCIMDCS